MEHITVMLHEAVDALNVQPDGMYVDGTFGRGGHSRLILSKLSQNGCLWVFDKDPRAVAVANDWAKLDSRIRVVHDSFRALVQHLKPNSVDGVLLDLGISSPQVDDASRGFSFRAEGPLDMRMDDTKGLSAADWLAQISEVELIRVIRDYGEEKYAKFIARAIIERRKTQPFVNTLDLAQVIAGQVKGYEKGKHPATRTFQAIRIAVNQELSDLEVILDGALSVMKKNARLSVISFHSLEDRMVKQFVASHSKHDSALNKVPLREDQLPPLLLKNLGKCKPSVNEIEQNPRSRSAILRITQKLKET